MECPKCQQLTMWNPYTNDVELYICYNIQCNHHQRKKPKEDKNMADKERMAVGQRVYIVLSEGVLKGKITKSMPKGRYTVETFLGNITTTEGKLYKLKDFGRACNIHQSMYGEK